MSLSNFEAQVLQDVLSLAVVVIGSLISALAVRARTWIANHMKAQTAATANTVVDALSKITNSVVQDFEANVVQSAKQNGLFTKEMAKQVKSDAMNAIKAQSGGLVSLGNNVLGDIDSLISSQIEQAILQRKAAPSVKPMAASERQTTSGDGNPSNIAQQSNVSAQQPDVSAQQPDVTAHKRDGDSGNG